MGKKKMFTRKRVTGIMSALLIAALLLGGTFAFVDFDQHKTNLAKGGENVSVTLNDSYKPPADWKEGQTLDKKVSVTNTAGGSDPIFVRVQFKEYFEMSELKLVTDGAGRGLLFATYADGVQKGEFMTWADAQAGGYDYIKQTVTYADGTTKDFALTQNAELRNGIYGKEMYIPSDVKVFGNAVKANYPTQPHETQSDTNLECQYPTHIWGTCGIKAADNDEIHNYISWTLGSQVIEMGDWIAAGKPTGDFWVLDTTDGWAYWANAVQPGQSTSNIMESIKLDNMPGNYFEYYIHIDMQATTADQLDELKTKGATTGGKDLIDELRKSTLTLPEIIAETPAGGTFTDNGIPWRVIATDENGYKLIVTENVYSTDAMTFDSYTAKYNTNNATPTPEYQDTTNTSGYLRYYQNLWYANNTSSDLKSVSYMPTLGYENNGNYSSGFYRWNLDVAISKPGAKADATTIDVAFPLSISEVNRFIGSAPDELRQAKDTSGIDRSWWLRSPGYTEMSPCSYVTRSGNVTFSVAWNLFGFRPALWVKP